MNVYYSAVSRNGSSKKCLTKECEAFTGAPAATVAVPEETPTYESHRVALFSPLCKSNQKEES